MKENEMLKQFNLPKYIDGLSFAEASKKIQSRFKDRTDKESIETEREMLTRLKDMQEFVKQKNEQKQQEDLDKQRDPGAIIAGDAENDPSNISSQENQNIEENYDLNGNEFAYGGYGYNNESLNLFKGDDYIPPTKEQLFAPTINTKNVPIEESITSLAGTASSMYGASSSSSNKFWSGGYQDEYSNSFNNDPNISQQTAQLQQQNQSVQNPQQSGSMMSSIIGGIGGSGGGGSSVGGYAALGTTALDLGKQAFGPTGVNTSGAVKVKPKKAGNAALSGAAKGATAGAVLGPWGAAAGAVVGSAAGYFGAKKHNKEANIANRNATWADASKNDNQFDLGGYENSDSSLMGSIIDDPKLKQAESNNIKRIIKYQPGVTNNKGINGYYLFSKDPSDPSFNAQLDREFVNNSGMKVVQRTPQWQEYMRNNKTSNQFAKGGKIPKPKNNTNPDLDISLLNNNKNNLIDYSIIGDYSDTDPYVSTNALANFEKYANKKPDPTTLDLLKSTGSKVYDFASNNLDALRYAPAIGNLMQLNNLKKPQQETTATLGNRYNKQLVDESALLNLIRDESSANREAILSASGGSESAARANLLASQLNSTRAISDAYLKASGMNADEARQEQSFNLGVDQINLNQDNLAKDIRARNIGNYETQKSRLQSAVADDLGSIGQEELYKKFPELLGMDYNWKGEFKKAKDKEEKKKK